MNRRARELAELLDDDMVTILSGLLQLLQIVQGHKGAASRGIKLSDCRIVVFAVAKPELAKQIEALIASGAQTVNEISDGGKPKL